jgi:cytochrome c-type biogenesis protein CcsB
VAGNAVNENLAQMSNVLIYSAIAVYMIAFFAYAWEWAFGTRSKVGRTAASLTPERELVGAGGPTVVVQGSGHDAGDSEDFGDLAGDSVKADTAGRIAISTTVLAFLLHAGGLLTRGLAVKRAPWGNMYEFSVAVALVVVAAYLILLALKKPVRWLGVFVTLPVLAGLGVAVTVLYTDSEQLVPALHSYWLWIHVSSAIVSFGALHLGAFASILFLVRDSYDKRRKAGRTSVKADDFFQRLPAAAALDKFAYRVNAIIFPLWTFAIVAGAVWAENAWGRYWGWDPKETWSFITWVAYAAYLHARATGGWKGRRAAYISLVAFSCFIINYYIVNIFVNGLHSYSGV